MFGSGIDLGRVKSHSGEIPLEFDLEGREHLEWTSQKIFWAWDKEPVKVSLIKVSRN